MLCSIQEQYKDNTFWNFEHFLTCFPLPVMFFVKSTILARPSMRISKIPAHSDIWCGDLLFSGFISHVMRYLEKKSQKIWTLLTPYTLVCRKEDIFFFHAKREVFLTVNFKYHMKINSNHQEGMKCFCCPQCPLQNCLWLPSLKISSFRS